MAMRIDRLLVLATMEAIFVCSSNCSADMFGSGDNSFAVEFVTIGDPGNPADTTGAPNPVGSVSYVYRIGKYEISRSMIQKANAAGGMEITLFDMTEFDGYSARFGPRSDRLATLRVFASGSTSQQQPPVSVKNK